VQDHRTYPTQLPVKLLRVSFNELRHDPRLRIFQFHMGVGTSFAVQNDPRTFETVELAYNDNGNRSQTAPTRVKLAAQRCVRMQIRGLSGRMKRLKHPQFSDEVARCAFLIDDELVLRLRDHVRAQASFDVHACNDTVHFPLAEVLHFPQPSPIIEYGLLPRPTNGFPSSPWAGAEVQVVRASGPDAMLRVAAVVFKKFSWVADDNLWLLWMLDVVGVDHVVINVATRDLPMEVARESMDQHESLAGRVTLVDLDFPSRGSNHSYSYLLQAQAHELFLRWQADFDFIFLIDQDEFPQLFDTNANSNQSSTAQPPPQPRIDIKTLIGRNRESFEEQGQVYFARPFVQRSESNKKPEPLLPGFLRELAPLDGLVTSAVWSDSSYEALGKALFPVGAALRPYLHYNDHWPKRTFDWRAGHVLHVRERAKASRKLRLQWFLDQVAQRKANKSQKP
jgi:hypothetical protein